MNKFLLVVGILSIAVLTLGVAGFAYAQSQNPPAPEYPYGPGMMGDYDEYGYAHGMMGGYGRGYDHDEIMGGNSEFGPMHEAMIGALAEALDITPEEVETRHEAGETLWQFAAAEGLTDEEIRDVMLSIHDRALEDTIANDWLTEEQAEWMDAHMEHMWSGDSQSSGFGDHCGGGFYNNTSWQSEN